MVSRRPLWLERERHPSPFPYCSSVHSLPPPSAHSCSLQTEAAGESKEEVHFAPVNLRDGRGGFQITSSSLLAASYAWIMGGGRESGVSDAYFLFSPALQRGLPLPEEDQSPQQRDNLFTGPLKAALHLTVSVASQQGWF